MTTASAERPKVTETARVDRNVGAYDDGSGDRQKVSVRRMLNHDTDLAYLEVWITQGEHTVIVDEADWIALRNATDGAIGFANEIADA